MSSTFENDEQARKLGNSAGKMGDQTGREQYSLI